jgi:hypothetical protein
LRKEIKMSKRRFITPVFLSGGGLDIGDDPDPGLGSGQGSPDVEPWPWDMWQWMYEDDDSNDDGIPGTYDDYVAWMNAHGFGEYITPEE